MFSRFSVVEEGGMSKAEDNSIKNSNSKLYSFFMENNIKSFRREMDKFIGYIVRRYYSYIKQRSDFFLDMRDDVFYFVYEKLLDERYMYNENINCFDSYCYYLIRWGCSFYLYRSKKESGVRSLDDMVFLDSGVDNEFLCKLYERVDKYLGYFDLGVDLRKDVIDYVINVLYFNKKVKRIDFIKDEVKLLYTKYIAWMLWKDVLFVN